MGSQVEVSRKVSPKPPKNSTKRVKYQCSKSVYPFHDGLLEDFEPVFNHLIVNNINDGYSSSYTEAFLPAAANLVQKGDEALTKDKSLASSYYLRAACLYRISRFPYIYTPLNQAPISGGATDGEIKAKAWVAQKEVYMKAATLWDQPIHEIMIPHIHAHANEGKEIPVYVRFPTGVDTTKSWPTVLLITGLDGYRPDNTQRTNEFLSRGWATVIAEIPGTADCPSEPSDPLAPERLWTSILTFLQQDGRFDMKNLMAWGLSAGGYYAIRLAHTHKDSFKGIVAQGAGVHLGFSEEWLRKADGHEYPFALGPAYAAKFGYGGDVEGCVRGLQGRFSLVESGVVKGASCRLLLVNVSALLLPSPDVQ